jgi:hypothetical protein
MSSLSFSGSDINDPINISRARAVRQDRVAHPEQSVFPLQTTRLTEMTQYYDCCVVYYHERKKRELGGQDVKRCRPCERQRAIQLKKNKTKTGEGRRKILVKILQHERYMVSCRRREDVCEATTCRVGPVKAGAVRAR